MSFGRYENIDTLDGKYLNENLPIVISDVKIVEDSYTARIFIKIAIKNIGKKEIEYLKVKIKSDNEKIEIKEIEIKSLKSSNVIIGECSLNYDMIDLKRTKLYVENIKFENQEEEIKEYLLQKLEDESIMNEIVNKNMWRCICSNIWYNDIEICPNCKVPKDKILRAKRDAEAEKQKKKEKVELSKFLIFWALFVVFFIGFFTIIG